MLAKSIIYCNCYLYSVITIFQFKLSQTLNQNQCPFEPNDVSRNTWRSMLHVPMGLTDKLQWFEKKKKKKSWRRGSYSFQRLGHVAIIIHSSYKEGQRPNAYHMKHPGFGYFFYFQQHQFITPCQRSILIQPLYANIFSYRSYINH